jgi:Spy/CpxP family protein refolding chaperone
MLKKLLFSGLLAAALACAQDRMGDSGMSGGPGSDVGSRGSSGKGEDMGGSMARAIPTPMERIATLFNLNKDQRKQVRTIMDDGQKEAIPVRDRMIKGRQTIAQAVAAGKSQDEIDAAIKEYAAAQAQMAQIELRAVSKIYQALEKDQQAKAGPLLGMVNGIFKGKNWDTVPTRSN